MKRKLTAILTVLLAGLIVQIRFNSAIRWCPDLVLLVVVYTSIFEGFGEGLIVGLAAGLLRGFFSVYTLPVDVFILLSIVVFASFIARMFYQQTPVTQIFITAVSILFLIVAHSIYLNAISGNQLEIIGVIGGSWRVVVTTIIISPFFYTGLNLVTEKIRKQ